MVLILISFAGRSYPLKKHGLARWPQTIPVFIHHHMACVGGTMAPFETLAEIATVYKLDLDNFLRELEQSIRQTEKQN